MSIHALLYIFSLIIIAIENGIITQLILKNVFILSNIYNLKAKVWKKNRSENERSVSRKTRQRNPIKSPKQNDKVKILHLLIIYNWKIGVKSFIKFLSLLTITTKKRKKRRNKVQTNIFVVTFCLISQEFCLHLLKIKADLLKF